MSNTWVHYHRGPLDAQPPAVDPGPFGLKAYSGCYYFAPGTSWRDWAVDNLPPRGYTHKYVLENLQDLQILVIDSSYAQSVGDVEHLGIPWFLYAEDGYDGVLIRRADLLAHFSAPSPWRYLALACEHDELIVWRNLRVVEQRLDFPKEYYLRSNATKDFLASLTKKAIGVGADFGTLLMARE